ncbi:hypothetical protein D0860_06711 [Hortaea werneckii]|uniref:Uncharacterized protein n=1 Tax=Hortaea werneckii TaxID=91943 RepID=A0A3M7IPK5_HORWE|nr:hypothetical protein D0860_06711 [Hortaea werneckii]RMZ27444.1 hypothetical protein D0859_08475 [Hortaea werneckii]
MDLTFRCAILRTYNRRSALAQHELCPDSRRRATLDRFVTGLMAIVLLARCAPISDAARPAVDPEMSPQEPSSPDPANPLLAYREPQPLPCMSHAESNDHFMQVQTAAAHSKAPHRPSPHPLQNMLYTSSESSAESDDSAHSTDSLGSGLTSPIETARCSRCQRTPSLDVRTGKSNMVSYGLNLWYCTRCAAMVGFKTG